MTTQPDQIIDIKQINDAVKRDAAGLAMESECRFDGMIEHIAQNIAATRKTKIVLMSGPSASGKTTTAHKIKHRLEELDSKAIIISMDNFFIGKDKTPLLPNGKPDHETIEALDLQELGIFLSDLIERKTAMLPSFDFFTGRPKEAKTRIELGDDDIVILEGIHALSPRISEGLPAENLFRIFISVETSVYEDGEKLLSPRNIRFLRRLIRDYKFRGSSAANTFDMWPQVCRGEDLYILPIRQYADIAVNSFFPSEIGVISGTACELLKETPSEPKEDCEKAVRLMSALAKFTEVSQEYIPGSSLLREFLGDGSFDLS